MSRCSGMRRRSRQKALCAVHRKRRRSHLVLVARTKRKPKRDEQGLGTRERGAHGLESRIRGIETAIGYVLYAVLLIGAIGIEARVHRAAVSGGCRNRRVGRAGRSDRNLKWGRTVHGGRNAGCVDGQGTIQIVIRGKLRS